MFHSLYERNKSPKLAWWTRTHLTLENKSEVALYFIQDLSWIIFTLYLPQADNVYFHPPWWWQFVWVSQSKFSIYCSCEMKFDFHASSPGFFIQNVLNQVPIALIVLLKWSRNIPAKKTKSILLKMTLKTSYGEGDNGQWWMMINGTMVKISHILNPRDWSWSSTIYE